MLVGFGVLAVPGVPHVGAAETKEIDLTYDSTMNMVRPELHNGIMVHHDLHVTIAGGNQLAEHRDRSSGTYADANATTQVLGESGPRSDYVSWTVMPDGRFVRTENDPHSVRTMTVTLLPGNRCRLDVVDQLKPGFTDYAFMRITPHTMGYFSDYRVTHTSCWIR
jgi:hypothetical protein